MANRTPGSGGYSRQARDGCVLSIAFALLHLVTMRKKWLCTQEN
jgi:hypothetical protein